mgnify:CR=1 FL=1
MSPDTPSPSAEATADKPDTSTTVPALVPPIRLRQDSHGRLYRSTSNKGMQRHDEHGQPLTRLRLSKKHKLKLRRAGLPITKWIQTTPEQASPSA